MIFKIDYNLVMLVRVTFYQKHDQMRFLELRIYLHCHVHVFCVQ